MATIWLAVRYGIEKQMFKLITKSKIDMKKMRLLPSAVLAANLLLAAVSLSSCEIADEANERAKVLNSGQMVNGYKISIIEFDSCQYLISGNGYSQMMTHKGNCKFCAARHSRLAVVLCEVWEIELPMFANR